MLLQTTTARVSVVRKVVPTRLTTTRTRVSSHESIGTPENVEEARQWIAAWRAKQEGPASVAADGAQKPKSSRGRPKAVKPPASEGDSPAPPSISADPPAAASAPVPASIPKPAAPKWGTELNDGSIVFSMEQLKDRTKSKAALDRIKKGRHAMSPSPNSS